ncbi:MAG: hypothetical protein KGZ63_02415 [Clostridiales bacterium]|nr:hypothetical protein [Clostridiales bacterium]
MNQNEINSKQILDTGLVFVLIVLLVAFRIKNLQLVLLAIVLLLISMSAPRVFSPLAKIWFGLSHLVGTVVSKVLLTLVFFLIVTPIAVVRKLLGGDSMQSRVWKKSKESVFKTYDKEYKAEHLRNPY